jgi:saccharopine dehydrogenase-like NADP-dependent oxidoreductase
MRILVTGGGGDMGAYACRALAGAAEVDEVLIADRHEARAAALADELGAKTAPVGLDISDSGALRELLAGVDVVLNTAGPFYRFGRVVLEAAIEAKTHYLDICDDWEPTLEMLELDDQARAAGITAIIGMGASPGTSNVLARLAMNECDTVDRVFTAWRASAPSKSTRENPEPESNAALVHWVHNCSDPIKVWREGALVDAYALEELTLAYPGRGEDPVWICGHPEPLTIPRVRPEVRESYNVMTSRRGLMDAMTRVAQRVRSGDLDVAGASRQILVEPNLGGPGAGPSPNLPNLFAVAEGTKDGRRIRVGAQPLRIPNANMGEMTGYPLAVATLMLVRGQVDSPGVHGPEGAVDPELYFAGLGALAGANGDATFEVVKDDLGGA